MRKVYEAADPTEAHLVKGLLEAEGIDCWVSGDLLFSARGEIPVTEDTCPGVWIRQPGQLLRARGIIEAMHRPAAPSARAWRCPDCGETLEAQFTDCWRCGCARP
jgi:hypothetical protein